MLDVSGHGVGAALLSFTLNHMLSPTAEGALLSEDTGQGPGVVAPFRVAERLNRQFPMDRTRQYFTLVYGVFDPAHVAIPVTSWPGIRRRSCCPGPDRQRRFTGGGLPIGMIEHATFDDEAVTLQPGDRLYLYTDGVIEALNESEQEFGHARLIDRDRAAARPSSAGRARRDRGDHHWSNAEPVTTEDYLDCLLSSVWAGMSA